MSWGWKERLTEEMLELGDAEWNLKTMLRVMSGLYHHSNKVSSAAVGALLAIGKRRPAPVQVEPLPLVKYFMIGSPDAPYAVWALLELGIPEAEREAAEILKSSTQARNQDFQRLLNAVIEFKRPQLLNELKDRKLSQAKAKMVKQALERLEKTHANPGDPSARSE